MKLSQTGSDAAAVPVFGKFDVLDAMERSLKGRLAQTYRLWCDTHGSTLRATFRKRQSHEIVALHDNVPTSSSVARRHSALGGGEQFPGHQTLGRARPQHAAYDRPRRRLDGGVRTFRADAQRPPSPRRGTWRRSAMPRQIAAALPAAGALAKCAPSREKHPAAIFRPKAAGGSRPGSRTPA